MSGQRTLRSLIAKGTALLRNPLVPYLIGHGLAGALAGWLAVAMLLTVDTGGLGTLIMASDLFPLPLIMLLGFFGLTFASVAMGAAIMGLGRATPGQPGMPAPAAARRARSRGRQSVAMPVPPGPAARRR